MTASNCDSSFLSVDACRMLVDKIEKSLQFFDKSGLLTNELSQQLMKCKTTEDIKLLGSL